MREITNADLWAAIRGLRMARMTIAELATLEAEHRGNPLFASQVIAKAANQYAAIKQAREAPRKRR